MESLHIFTYKPWYPLKAFGLTGPKWVLHSETIIATWVTLILLLAIGVIIRWAVRSKNEKIRYCGMSYVGYFINACRQSLGMLNVAHSAFLASLFTFIVATTITPSFIPWLEEPTSDLNTTLGLGLTSFFYVQIAGIRAHGIRGYLKEYFTPVFLFPLHVTGKLVSIVSLSFRLFGNIFGGSIITKIYTNMKLNSFIGEMIGMALGLNLVVTVFFGLFEGLIQAFVFFTLTLTYLALGLQDEHEQGA